MSRKKSPLDENSLGGRLRIFREAKGINILSFAKLLDISHGSLSDIENNKTKPSFKPFEGLIRKTDININWLLTGEGHMIRNEPENEASSKLIEGRAERREGDDKPEELSLLRLEKRLQKLEAALDNQNLIEKIARLTNKIEILQNTILKEIPPEGIEERRKCMQILETVIGPMESNGP